MILKLITDKENLKGFDEDINYIGNYKLQKLYSFLFQNFIFKLVLNMSAYIHDLQYSSFFKSKNKTFFEKFLIDLNFLINNFLCVFVWLSNSPNDKLKYLKFIYLFLISQIFFLFVILASPIYFLKK